MPATEPRSIWPLGAPLLEGPLWHPADKALWFVCIKTPAIHRLDPATGARQSWPAPAQVGFVVPVEGSAGLVAGLVSVFAAPDDDRAVDTGQPITVGDDSPEAVPPEVGFTLADDDVREFLTAYQERFDTLDAYEVDFYEDWVSVQVPVRGSRARTES